MLLQKVDWSFFSDVLSPNGVILVHDYFAENFEGPRVAVDEFCSKDNRFKKIPIGDGISICLVKNK